MSAPSSLPTAANAANAAPARRCAGLGFALLALGWVAAVSGAFAALAIYKATPGVLAPAPLDWPEASSIARLPGRAQLLCFVLPHCPCAEATLAELSRLLSARPAQAEVHVVIALPPGVDPSWRETAIVAAASELPGAHLTFDVDLVESARFGATTSGQVLVYDGAGRLAFRGGVTPSRGHRGENAGSDAVAALVRGEAAQHSVWPVFGCELATPLAEEAPP
ncbi:MAG: RedB protein [Planctomycetes bacterium]|nr:RedB protein [Planctomycetota bacterium]